MRIFCFVNGCQKYQLGNCVVSTRSIFAALAHVWMAGCHSCAAHRLHTHITHIRCIEQQNWSKNRKHQFDTTQITYTRACVAYGTYVTLCVAFALSTTSNNNIANCIQWSQSTSIIYSCLLFQRHCFWPLELFNSSGNTVQPKGKEWSK